ncbi:MAG: hypothetical protein ACD_20C00134G0019 [uncultured bacterium]|nr:MAG: hypothetical protein ACD_20C00134G0019 [uncultured bacterium]HBH17921.1 ATP synthase F0 subunit C [Cyanobacteria bacterium UBA9579]
MDPKTASVLAMGIAVGLGALGPGIGMGIAVAAYMNAVSRQPEAEGKLKPFLFIGLGLMEALAIYALVIALILLATQVLA